MSDEEKTRNPFRCFDAPFLLGALLVGIAIVVLARVSRGFPLASPARLGVATAQALLVAGLVVACVLAIRKLDELLLKVHLEAIAVSFAVIGAVIAAWGMLELAGAPRVEWGVWAWPAMTLVWGVAVIVRTRQYR